MPHNQPFRFGVNAFGPANRHGWVELAHKVEALGYSTLSVDDHAHWPLAPVPALAIAAEATTRLRIGSLVFSSGFRHPVAIARDAATLDLLTDGRFELGIGAGYATSDEDMTGIGLGSPGTRIDRLAETVRIVKGAFGTEPFSFSGEHYTVRNLAPRPAPIQQPHPPLLVGGGNRRVLQIASREADIVGINLNTSHGTIDSTPASSSPEATERKVAWIREAAGERLHRIELQIIVAFVAITEDVAGAASRLIEQWNVSDTMTLDDMLTTPHGLIGTEDQIVELLQERRERFGISYITVLDSAIDTMAPIVARLAGC